MGTTIGRLPAIKPPQTWKDFQTHYLNAIGHPWYHALSNLQDIITVATYRFFNERGLKALNLPITTGSISSPMGLGSDSLPVEIDLMGQRTYLADSMQFMLEYGCRLMRGGCYYIMPSFRGEAIDARHLNQFFHSEAEIPGSLADVIVVVQDYIAYLCRQIMEASNHSLRDVLPDVSHILDMIERIGRPPEITHLEAIKILKHNPNYVEDSGHGFQIINSLGEKELLRIFNGVVWLKNFPAKSVPFYQARDPRDVDIVLNADLLFGIGEVVGTGERHFGKTDVLRALQECGVDQSSYDWYLEMKAVHPMKTSGFGMGVERFMLWVLRHNDIRDCQILPRENGRNIIP